MSKKLNYGLNLQMFADPTNEPGNPGNEPAPNTNPTHNLDIDYDKLAETLEKRASKSEESALKGILKAQGLSQEELNSAIKGYKESKANKAKEEQDRINAIFEENKRYKQAEIQKTINDKAKDIAKKAGAREDRIGSLLRLCDANKFVDEKGAVDEKGMQAEIEAQLKTVPEFKTGKRVKISAVSGTQTPSEMSDEDEYFKRKYKNNRYFKG